ncbi:MAG: response regulator transcription factor, partial [Chloroflexota bacterium]
MNKILVVDDEKSIREFVSRNLTARGFEVHTAANGLEGLALFKTKDPDLIVLDIMMPNMDGLETCRRIRNKSIVPIIVLTALDEEADRVQALDAGADDCLTKPFGVEELMARVRAALRRMAWIEKKETQSKMQYREILLDPELLSVRVRGTTISLTQTEFNLLHYFMQHIGKTVPHQLILKSVWGPEYGNEAEYLRVYIGRIRRKIEVDPSKPQYLFTEFGIGYRFGES